MQRCPHCNREVLQDSLFCGNCGGQVRIPSPAKKRPSCLFLSCSGIIIAVLLLMLVVDYGSDPERIERASEILASDFELRLSGTQGLGFSGNYMLVHLGSSESKSVEGTVPTSYKVRGTMVSAFFQKQSEDGELILKILRDGREVHSVETDAAYGTVTAAIQ